MKQEFKIISSLINENSKILDVGCGNGELMKYILENISKNMQKELDEYLAGRLVPVSKVEDSIDEIMKIVTRKIEKGELVLDRGSSETIIE